MKNLFTTLTICAASALCSGSIALAVPASTVDTPATGALTPEQQNLYINYSTKEIVRVSPDGQQAVPVSIEELQALFPNGSQTPNVDSAQGVVDELALHGGGGRGGGGHGGGHGGRGGWGHGGRGGYGRGGYGRGGYGRGGYGRGGYGRGGWGGGWYPYIPCDPYYYPYYNCY